MIDKVEALAREMEARPQPRDYKLKIVVSGDDLTFTLSSDEKLRSALLVTAVRTPDEMAWAYETVTKIAADWT